MGAREIGEAIRKHDDYIVTSHVNMEGDAIGSELAIFYLVKQLGKRAIVVNNDPVPKRYRFLPGTDKIVSPGYRPAKEYSNLIIVDCPNIERSGSVAPIATAARIKINIDHHVSNSYFGDFNWVHPEASSCGEMIFNLYKEMKLNINEDIAKLLYVAILTDTGSFRYDSTSPYTHRAAGELIKIGVKPDKIAEKIYETKRIEDIALLSRALSTIRLTPDGKISTMYVTAEMFGDGEYLADRTDGFVDYARSVEGAEISLFFRESAGGEEVHVSMRSKGRANVNILAGKFGGGGHPKASGCVLKGRLKIVMENVIKTAEEFLL